MMRANLWLRTASRVIVRVAEFEATAFYELEKKAKKIDWKPFLPPGAKAEFRVTTRKSKLYHSDGIAERLLAVSSRLSERPTPTSQQQLFVVRVERDRFTVSVDSSGELLHMRGYRQEIAKAPLRETLAAALLLGAEWRGDRALVDPMCGSGTIPIEAAMIARRIAPGRRRDFAFTRWPGFDDRAWGALLAAADADVLPRSLVPIHGSDRDAGAIAASQANAERAGVAADVVFRRQAISAAPRPADTGLVATNPPYGKRVGVGVRGTGERDVRDLYAQLGKLMRGTFEGWDLAFFSPDDRLARQVGLPLEPVLKTTNGGIKVSVMRAK